MIAYSGADYYYYRYISSRISIVGITNSIPRNYILYWNIFYVWKDILYESIYILSFSVFRTLFHVSHELCTYYIYEMYIYEIFSLFFPISLPLVSCKTISVLQSCVAISRFELIYTVVISRDNMTGQSGWNVTVMNTRIVPKSLPFPASCLPFHVTPVLDRPALIPPLRMSRGVRPWLYEISSNINSQIDLYLSCI